MAQHRIAELEGIFCEPASAAGVAGVARGQRGPHPRLEGVVCILTGHGLKDPDAIAQEGSLRPVGSDLVSVRRAMGLLAFSRTASVAGHHLQQPIRRQGVEGDAVAGHGLRRHQ